MARASVGWRRRSDGVFELPRRGPRLRAGPVALGLLSAALATVLTVFGTFAVRVGFVAALALMGVALLVRRAHRRARTPATPAATVLALAHRPAHAPSAARDTGA